MTNPHDDLSSIADPGAMGPDAMTEPDNGNPGDLDVDHAGLARDDAGPDPLAGFDSPARHGSPVGPPD